LKASLNASLPLLRAEIAIAGQEDEESQKATA
jgi:hypothetical protein